MLVLEKRQVGAGASGGFMGALMPHVPDRWNAKKQMQFDALRALPQLVAELEADTGIKCGYRRCGRLIPIVSERTLAAVEARRAGAAIRWPGFHLELLDASAIGDSWLDPAGAPHGVQWDDLSARIDPRAYVRALAAYVTMHPAGEIREGSCVVSIDALARCVEMEDGNRLGAQEICVAAGFEAYPLLQPFMGEGNGGDPIGRGVKGQALLLDHSHDDSQPILYHDSAYIIPHANNRVALGSSSHHAWSGAPDAFDESDTAFHRKAIELAPSLAGASIVEQWANVRPRNSMAGRGTEPFLGDVPGFEGLTARIGGFKIGMGVGGVR